MHFTTGNNNVTEGKQGSRIPGIWLNSYQLQGDKTYFYVSIENVLGKGNNVKTHIINLNEWYSIEMNQEDGQFTLIVNGVTAWTVTETVFSQQSVFQDVKWYQSDPWHPSAMYDPNGDSQNNMIELINLQVEP